jgi:O-antigen/teichoic acid export membrane protein
MDRRSFKADLLTTTGAKSLSIGLSFIANIIIARFLLPEGSGIYAAILVLPQIILSFGNLGLRQASTYFIGKDVLPKEDVVSTMLLIAIPATILAATATALGFLVQDLDKYGWTTLAPALLIAPAKICIDYGYGAALGMRWVRQVNTAQSLESIIRLTLVLIFVCWLGLGVQGALLAFLGALIIEIIFILQWLPKIAPLHIRYIPKLPGKMIKKGLLYATGLTVMALTYKGDILILEHFVPPTDIGHYAIGVTLAELIWQLPSVLGFVIFSHGAASTDEGTFSNKVWKIAIMMTLMAGAGGIVVALIAPFLVETLYGAPYLPSVKIIRILLPGIVSMVGFKILNSDLAGRGRPEITILFFGMALVANIGLNFLLIPKYGISGAAASSTLTYSLGALCFSIYYYRHFYASRHKVLSVG